MQFAVTYLMDQLAPSETFIQRELDQLVKRNWPIKVCLLKGGPRQLLFAPFSCPRGFRLRFIKVAVARVLEELLRAPSVALRILKRLPQAAALVREVVDTDTRLLHSQFASITADLAGIAARSVGINWSCSVHAHDIYCTAPEVTRRRLQTAAGIAACTEQVAAATAAAGVPQERIHLVRHGLPLIDYPLSAALAGEFVFIACRLTRKKGLDTLIKACAVLKGRGLKIPCVIAGTGSELTKLKQLCAKLNLNDQVLFKGWLTQAEIRRQIQSALLVALPSRQTPNGDRDGMANVLVEALALGTPIITTTASAASEVIVNEKNGILVEPDDQTALADAIEKIVGSKSLRAQLAREGRKTAESLFDGTSNILQLENFFKRAVVIATETQTLTQGDYTPT
ncbi:MAG: glycosyltransferase family 4 protein [Kiritimatiellae bacterium]|nr:glycosyltransferase family 4 protein [Kiritimatiellia bacterium]